MAGVSYGNKILEDLERKRRERERMISQSVPRGDGAGATMQGAGQAMAGAAQLLGALPGSEETKMRAKGMEQLERQQQIAFDQAKQMQEIRGFQIEEQENQQTHINAQRITDAGGNLYDEIPRDRADRIGLIPSINEQGVVTGARTYGQEFAESIEALGDAKDMIAPWAGRVVTNETRGKFADDLRNVGWFKNALEQAKTQGAGRPRSAADFDRMVNTAGDDIDKMMKRVTDEKYQDNLLSMAEGGADINKLMQQDVDSINRNRFTLYTAYRGKNEHEKAKEYKTPVTLESLGLITNEGKPTGNKQNMFIEGLKIMRDIQLYPFKKAIDLFRDKPTGDSAQGHKKELPAAPMGKDNVLIPKDKPPIQKPEWTTDEELEALVFRGTPQKTLDEMEAKGTLDAFIDKEMERIKAEGR